jgi:hypothetical protein
MPPEGAGDQQDHVEHGITAASSGLTRARGYWCPELRTD